MKSLTYNSDTFGVFLGVLELLFQCIKGGVQHVFGEKLKHYTACVVAKMTDLRFLLETAEGSDEDYFSAQDLQLK